MSLLLLLPTSPLPGDTMSVAAEKERHA